MEKKLRKFNSSNPITLATFGDKGNYLLKM